MYKRQTHINAWRAVLGESNFAYHMARRDEWRDNPKRLELQDLKMSSSNILFELGGNAASIADRSKAGLGREVNVGVKSNAPHFGMRIK